MGETPKPNAVGWFEIYVYDMSRATAFYEAVFEVKLEPLKNPTTEELPGFEMMSFPGSMTSYGAPGALAKMDGMEAGKNSTIVYFSCQDCSIEEKRAKDAGGTVVQPKMAIGEHGFISLVTDTEGTVIGLHSMK